MTTFKGIRGTAIQVVSSDPSNPEIGQIWYNSSNGTLKGYLSVGAVWSSGGNLNNARYGLAGAGTQTAALGFGGYGPVPGTTNSTKTESYNGTSWTTSPANLNQARYAFQGIGTQTAALGAGGYFYPGGNTSYVESYNGSAWTAQTALPAARGGMGSAGTSNTAGIFFGGSDAGNLVTTSSQSWNGSSWTAGGTMNTARQNIMGTGTQTAALAAGGLPSYRTSTESYNGSTWTTLNSLNTGRQNAGGGGTQSLAYICGGDTGSPTAFLTATELWNGTTWTTNPTGLVQKRASLPANLGTQTAGITFGGYSPPSSPITLASTELLINPTLATKTITVS
jgi:hypothetical protein